MPLSPPQNPGARRLIAQVDKNGNPVFDKEYKDNCLIYQPWIREPKKSIADLIKETSAKVGENIVVRRFTRYQMGEE